MTSRRLRSDWRGPLVVAAAIALLAAVSLSIDPAPYRWMFGFGEPAFAVLGLIALGVPALVRLHRSGLFLFNPASEILRGLPAAFVLAMLFAVLVVLVDLVVGFPQTYNVPPEFPGSLLFFAVIGYVAEMAFHVIPMAVIVTLVVDRVRSSSKDTTLRLGMVAAACLEPIFQARLGLSGVGFGFTWIELFVVMHVFAINLVQLGLFRQFGFSTAYSFRLIYYLLWHIAWGGLRQDWLY